MYDDMAEAKTMQREEVDEFREMLIQRAKSAQQTIDHLERELMAQGTIRDMAKAALEAFSQRHPEPTSVTL